MTPPHEEQETPLVYDAQHSCFGCGELSEVGLRLRFARNSRGEAVCRFQMPAHAQGPHGFTHGGLIATVLDEAMSKAIHASPEADGRMAMTRRFEIDYLRPVPLGAALVARGRQVRVEGRKHWTAAELEDAAGVVLARAEGLFIAIARDSTHKH
jgi:uncharacterized protein (TIGR00369 family)